MKLKPIFIFLLFVVLIFSTPEQDSGTFWKEVTDKTKQLKDKFNDYVTREWSCKSWVKKDSYVTINEWNCNQEVSDCISASNCYDKCKHLKSGSKERDKCHEDCTDKCWAGCSLTLAKQNREYQLTILDCIENPDKYNPEEKSECQKAEDSIEAGYTSYCPSYKSYLIDRKSGCSWDFYNQYCYKHEREMNEDCTKRSNELEAGREYMRKEYPGQSLSIEEVALQHPYIMNNIYEVRGLAQLQYCTDNTYSMCLATEPIDVICGEGTPPPIVSEDTKIVVDPPHETIVGDGKTPYPITITYTGPKDKITGHKINFKIESLESQWSGDIGKLSKSSGTTDSNGRILLEYTPPSLLKSDLGYSKDGTLSIQITAGDGKTSGHGTYEIMPLDINATVIAVTPVQVLEGVPFVAGKEMAVFVLVAASTPDVYKTNENVRFRLKFSAETVTKDGKKMPGFYPVESFDILVDETPAQVEASTKSDFLQVIHPGESTDIELLKFLLPENSIDDPKIKLYIFYLDHADTRLEGNYIFTSKLYMERRVDPKSDKWEEKDFGGEETTVKVYPSKRFDINVYPVALGLWTGDPCDVCVKALDSPNPHNNMSMYEFTCTKLAFQRSGKDHLFDYFWEGKIDQKTVDWLFEKPSFLGQIFSPKESFCRENFQKSYTKEEFTAMASKDPAKKEYAGTKGLLTPKERYLLLADRSLQYFQAVMPIAEEDIILHFKDTPQSSLLVDPQTSSIMNLIARLETAKSNFFDSSLERFVAFVPTDGNREQYGTGYSFLNFDDEGYMEGMVADETVLVNHGNAGYTTMVHEIAHTYCAVDEYQHWLAQSAIHLIVIPLFCGEGALGINFHMGDDKGNKIYNGFWVEEKAVMGTVEHPAYSFMGKAETSQYKVWITEELYYGIGSNLGVFPTFKSYWKDKEEKKT
ncbi:MAG: hypothetical protein ABII22_05700 [Candidatus Micrarchaeota archaeon]